MHLLSAFSGIPVLLGRLAQRRSSAKGVKSILRLQPDEVWKTDYLTRSIDFAPVIEFPCIGVRVR